MNAAAGPKSDSKWPFGLRDGAAYLVAIVALVSLTAWGVGRKTTAIWVVGALLAGGVCWLASRQYRAWSTEDPAGRAGRATLLAVVGCGLAAAAAALLEHSSTVNSPRIASFGIALAFAGVMPVAEAVGSDINRGENAPPPSLRRYVIAWILNTVFIAAAVLPGLRIVGTPWLIAGGVAAIWLIAALLGRLAHLRLYRYAALLAAIGVVAIAVALVVVDVSTWKPSTTATFLIVGILVMLGLVDVVSAWMRNGPRRADEPSRARGMAIAAGLLLIGGVVWMAVRVHNAPVLVVLLVIATCALFGAAFITRGQGYAVAALVAGLVVWVVTDRTDDVPLDPSPQGSGWIVALGDSYIAGEGAQLFFPDTNISGHNDCRRSPSAFPYLVADSFDKHLAFYACSGAIAEHIAEVGQIKHPQSGDVVGALPQLDNPAPPEQPQLVLISIGGNDAFFGKIGKGCAMPGTCTELRDLFTGNLPDVRRRVAAALEEVATTYDGVPIVVVPYPMMLSPLGCAGAPLDPREFAYLHEFVTDLDGAVSNAVADANGHLGGEQIVWFADGVNAYSGAELCQPGRTGDLPVNVVTLAPTEADSLAHRMLPTTWIHNSFHPTARGHELMAAALEKWLAGRFPGFPAGSTASLPADPLPTPPGAGDGYCTVHPTCADDVDSWTTDQVVDAARGAFVPALLLFAGGWGVAVLWQRRRSALRR